MINIEVRLVSIVSWVRMASLTGENKTKKLMKLIKCQSTRPFLNKFKFQSKFLYKIIMFLIPT